MRINAFFLSQLLAVAAVCCVNSAWAHPGHDHSVPSGQWPEHRTEEEPAEEEAVAQAVPAAREPSPVQVAAITSNPGAEPRITAWKFSSGVQGSSDSTAIDNVVSQIIADVNTVAYNDNYVYIRTSGIPSHEVGPFNAGNPSVPGDVDGTYRISGSPIEQAGTKTSTGLGAIGVMVNGAGFYNASDGTFWRPQNNGITQPGGQQPPNSNWSTNALWYRAVENDGMDDAGGHPSPVNGSTNADGSTLGYYHYHRSPIGLLDQIDPGNEGTLGSPIVGFAFDGYPVVGPFAYADDSMTRVVQMISSFGVYGDRDAFPSPSPTVADYAMGSFLEDFVYNDGTGNLNEYNMAFVKFSEDGRAILTDHTDPDGDWAYFATIDAIDAMSGNDITRDGDVAYPYIVGPEYYGVVDTLMTMGGNINVPGNVTFYFEYEDADYNVDSEVDGADFLKWQRGESPDALSTSDLLNWKNQFGSGASANLSAAIVPEPSALVMLVLCYGIPAILQRWGK